MAKLAFIMTAVFICATVPPDASQGVSANRDVQCSSHFNLYPITISDKVGFIDSAGKVLVKPQFDFVSLSADGPAEARSDRGVALVEASGKITVYLQADDVGEFSEGLAAVKKDGVWGYVDRSGVLVIEPQFEAGGPFGEGVAAVKSEGIWKYIDNRGQPVLTLRTRGWSGSVPSPFSQGRAQLDSIDNKVGYIDRTGDWVIRPVYDEAEDFTESRAAVRVGDKWGYIDTKGKLVIPPKYETADSFSEGLAAIAVRTWQGTRFGFINSAGKLVIRPQFDEAHAFCGGLAAVNQHGAWGYIDPTGRFVIQPQFRFAQSFNGDLAAVILRDPRGVYRDAYIDKKGQTIWLSFEERRLFL